MESSCPWSGFTPGTTSFCEARLCAWIESPAIAFAGIFYIVVGFLILRDVRKNQNGWMIWFAIQSFCMGISSFLYHSTHALVFQSFDLFSMYIQSTLLLCINVKRIAPMVKVSKLRVVFFTLPWICLSAFLLLPTHPGSRIFIVFLITALALEIPAYLKSNPKPSMKAFSWAAVFFAVALLALKLEKTPEFCNPENHILQWHALWDGCAAICAWFLYRHYRPLAAALT